MKQLKRTIMMKTKTIVAIMLIALGILPTYSQGEKAKYANLDLKELKRTVLGQLLEDDLISKKRDMVFLELKDDSFVFNGEPLDLLYYEKYKSLLKSFRLGTGPNRAIYITPDCIAAGDFHEGSMFHGKSQGRLSISEAKSLYN